jgi:hypothetical protein
MSRLAGAVLEPDTVVGTGSYTAASPRMELGAMAPTEVDPPLGSYAMPGPIVDPGYIASLPHLRVPMVLPAQYVSSDYVRRYVTEPARLRRAVMERIADELEHDTAHLSVVRRAAHHPAFRQLSNLGSLSAPLALHRLRSVHRPLWLYFLQRLTRERPAEGAASVDEAAMLWRTWGKDRGWT